MNKEAWERYNIPERLATCYMELLETLPLIAREGDPRLMTFFTSKLYDEYKMEFIR